MSITGQDNSNSLRNPLEKSRTLDPNSGGGSKISYRECLKNHAANIGGNVTDGCGEFMPSGDDGTLEALICAACNCHRNFHRKDHHHADGSPMLHPLHLPRPLPSTQFRAAGAWGPIVQPVKMAFGGGGGGSFGTDSSSEELNFNSSAAAAAPPAQFGARKRFRSKFTAEQKGKMMEFAERIGWRIPREDDGELQRFCAEIGVKRQVFKVWMHNNKTSSPSAKKTTTTTPQEI